MVPSTSGNKTAAQLSRLNLWKTYCATLMSFVKLLWDRDIVVSNAASYAYSYLSRNDLYRTERINLNFIRILITTVYCYIYYDQNKLKSILHLILLRKILVYIACYTYLTRNDSHRTEPIYLSSIQTAHFMTNKESIHCYICYHEFDLNCMSQNKAKHTNTDTITNTHTLYINTRPLGGMTVAIQNDNFYYFLFSQYGFI